MLGYILVILAALLIAIMTACQKLYQCNGGVSISTGIKYSLLQGIFAASVFFVINGFRVEYTVYSILMALLQTILLSGYTIIGFKIISLGGVVVYSLFLMTGGMILPYIWGILFLGEPLTFFHSTGLIFIIISVILFQTKDIVFSPKLIGLCALVFVINGCTSIVSKLHQIEEFQAKVNANQFVLLTNLAQIAINSVLLTFTYKRSHKTRKIRNICNTKSILFIIASAAASSFSYLFQLEGAASIPATVLYPMITGGTILFSTIISICFFHEKITRCGWAGITLCLIGTVLMV